MRKVLPVAVAVFLAVLAGGYCILWYAQAAQIKKGVEQAIANINAKQNYITYQSIETSGFPSNVYVSIVKPHFSGRIDTLLKALTNITASQGKTVIGQAGPYNSLPEWNEDITLDGRIVLGVNALSDHYSYRSIGNWLEKGSLGGKATATTFQSAGDSVCILQMQRSGGIFGSLWSYGTLGRDGNAFLRDLRLLDCNASGDTVTDSATHAKLAANGPMRFYVTSAPRGDREELHLYLKSADAEVTQAGDKWIAMYYGALTPNQPFPPQSSRLGKQNIEINFSYDGPSDTKRADQNTPIDIELGKCDIHNDAGSFNATFTLTNGLKGADHSARLAFKVDMHFGPQYDALFQEGVRNFIAQIYANPDPRMAAWQPAVQKYTPDQLYAITYPVLPHLSALGSFTQALDISFEGNPDTRSGTISMPALELSVGPYGITGVGTAKLTQGHPIPQGNVMLNCRNCLTLVDDSVGYMGRIKTFMSYFDAAKAATITINQPLVDGVKGFLSALGTPSADKTSLTFAFVSDGGSSITISGKRPDEVMAMYREYVAPYVPAPAAGLPPASSAPAQPVILH